MDESDKLGLRVHPRGIERVGNLRNLRILFIPGIAAACTRNTWVIREEFLSADFSDYADFFRRLAIHAASSSNPTRWQN